MKITAIIIYPSAESTVTEPSGRKVWAADAGPVPWVKVGEEVVENAANPEAVAEIVFARWNRGSGHESAAFLAAERRSMSVGDMVAIPEMETTFRCGNFGWDPVPAPVADTIAPDGPDVMDIDYMFNKRREVA